MATERLLGNREEEEGLDWKIGILSMLYEDVLSNLYSIPYRPLLDEDVEDVRLMVEQEITKRKKKPRNSKPASKN